MQNQILRFFLAILFLAKRVFNKNTMVVEEAIHVIFNKSNNAF